MTHPYLVAIDNQINSLPALPTIVAQVIEVTADPESSAGDLMQVILPDQTMCSTILKVANSAFFGIPQGVSTIDRAVVVLGHEEIRNIVIGKAIFFFLSNPEYRQQKFNQSVLGARLYLWPYGQDNWRATPTARKRIIHRRPYS